MRRGPFSRKSDADKIPRIGVAKSTAGVTITKALAVLLRAERRSVRSRKVSRRIGTVSAAERENVTHARLEALENDDAAGEGVVGDSDEEFLLEESDEGSIPSHPHSRSIDTKRGARVLFLRLAGE